MSNPIPGQRDHWSADNPWAAPQPSQSTPAPGYLVGAPLGYGWELKPPRSNGRRGAMLAGAVAAYFAAWVALGFLLGVFVALTTNDQLSDAAWSAEFDRRSEALMPVLAIAGLVAQLVVLALLARRVQYRWFDTFLQIVPVYGMYFILMILWRNTDPDRYRPVPAPWQPEDWTPAHIPAG